MTPRKLNALVRVHAEVNEVEKEDDEGKSSSGSNTGYIDNIF